MKTLALTFILTLAAGQGAASSPAVPFGSHNFIYATHIKPNTETLTQMDDRVRTFYNNWKTAYLQQKCVVSPPHYRINYSGDQTVSEAHGYGMLITVLMAGHDASAQVIFDGMYYYYRAHPATAPAATRLMAWKQNNLCANVDGASTASDGDLDIAMSLLMADRQWGSCGAINYRTEANLMIAQIKQYDMDSSSRYIKLGNWATSGQYLNSTRSSDFMPSHYRSFQWSTGDAAWTGLINHTYYNVTAVAHATTGLLPDFIINPITGPAPAPANFLEDAGDANYDYNACRDPWRLGTDYLASGDPRALAAIQKIATWTKGAPINSLPANVRAGYTLAGASTASWNDFAFTGPFTVGAMGDASNQTLINNFWSHIRNATTANYYGDSIKLLSMIVVTGNWWQPEAMSDPCAVESPTHTPTRTQTGSPTRTWSPTPFFSQTPSLSASPSATLSASRTTTPSRTATPSPSPSPTPTPSLSVSGTRTGTPSPSTSASPSSTRTVTRTPSPAASSTATATPSASTTLSVSATLSATFNPTALATTTPTQTAKPGQGRGKLHISAQAPVPNPNPSALAVALEGDVDEIELRIYDVGMRCVADSRHGPATMGWASVSLPLEWQARAANGIYYYRLRLKRGGEAASGPAGKLLVLR